MNMLQMKAMILALNAFLDGITGKSLVLVSDNASVVACLKKHGGTISKVLCDLAQEVVPWPEIHLIALPERYVCRKKNILMDQLSHPDQVLPMEWSFLPWVFDLIYEVFGRPYIDLFAMRANTKLPLYVSPWHRSRTLFHISGTFSTPLPPPPLHFLCQVLSRVMRSTRLTLILIAPSWPQEERFTNLLTLLLEEPLKFSLLWDLLVQLHARKFHRGLKTLRLHMRKLSVTERLAFWERLQRSSLLISGVPWQHLSERVV